MSVYGYARVSTTDQSLDIQIAALKAAGCEKIRSEKQSGTTTNGRQELKTLLEFIDAGDVLMVTRIDRLARSIGDLQDIVRALKAKGVALRATEQPIDTSTAAGKALRAPWPAVEQFVAAALGLVPQTIWPSRYGSDNRPRRRAKT